MTEGHSSRVVSLTSPDTPFMVLGDLHGDGVGLARALDARGRAEPILSVGDIVGYSDGPTCDTVVARLVGEGGLAVRGNHEEWSGRDGKLAVVSDSRAIRDLSAATRSWMASLPDRIEVVGPGSAIAIASIVHSIRRPCWDDVRPHNVRRLLVALPSVRLVIVGHSHCPRFLMPGPDGRYTERVFDFTREEELTAAVGPQGPLIVDVGSLGRPRPSFDRREELLFGTYALVEPARGTVTLRRVLK